MEGKNKNSLSLDEKIVENLTAIELEKEKKILNLIAEIIVNATLKELYETSN